MSAAAGQDQVSRALRPLRLWLGMLVPPAAWMTQLFALYMLEEFISCTPGSQTPGVILGFGVRGIAVVLTLVTAGATIAAGALAVAAWRETTNDRDDPGIGGRGRWMAVAGLMNASLFLLIILLKLAPPLMLGVCRGSL